MLWDSKTEKTVAEWLANGGYNTPQSTFAATEPNISPENSYPPVMLLQQNKKGRPRWELSVGKLLQNSACQAGWKGWTIDAPMQLQM